MKILFLTNNIITESLFKWLIDEVNEEVVKFSNKLIIYDLKGINPDLIISYNYKYIISKDIIELYPRKIINLHISFLPWNRGAYPNVWSFLDRTPKGVTIHLIDKGIDTGDVIFQKEVFIDELRETLNSSYIKLNDEIQRLFIEKWDQIKIGNFEAKPQEAKGSLHKIKDFESIKHLLVTKGWDILISELVKNYRGMKNEGI